MALLIFLSRAAGAGIVAADFFLRSYHLLHRLSIAATGHARLFQLAALAPHKSFFQVISGSCDQSRRMMSVSSALLRWHSGLRASFCGFTSRWSARRRLCWALE